jgi:hypothetical protein
MAHRRAEPPVLLTNYQALDMYLSEVRSIRESRVFSKAVGTGQNLQRGEHHLSPEDGARGNTSDGHDHESSEEEGEYVIQRPAMYHSSE